MVNFELRLSYELSMFLDAQAKQYNTTPQKVVRDILLTTKYNMNITAGLVSKEELYAMLAAARKPPNDDELLGYISKELLNMIYHVTIERQIMRTQTQSFAVEAPCASDAYELAALQITLDGWVTEPYDILDDKVTVECRCDATGTVTKLERDYPISTKAK